MIKTVKFLVLFGVVLLLASCNQLYYQVYDLQSENMTQRDNSLIYENEDCRVMYNFWSNRGEVKFAIYNKTDKDIFVNMEQTFLVVNGQAHDYYQGRTYGQAYTAGYTTEVGVGASKLSSGGLWGTSGYMEDAAAIAAVQKTRKAESTASSVTTKEKEIECIPANSFKIINKCVINPEMLLTCDRKNDFPSEKQEIRTYTQISTPFSIVNRIAYGFNKDDVAAKHIDNAFWVSRITNYSQKGATESVMNEKCYNPFSVGTHKQFVIGGPDKFYVIYSNKVVD